MVQGNRELHKAKDLMQAFCNRQINRFLTEHLEQQQLIRLSSGVKQTPYFFILEG
jgi:hypothetical protein